MLADTALLEKRAELKRRLASGEYKTLVDVLLDGIGTFLQKITRSSSPISHWVSTAFLFILIMVAQNMVANLAGDLPRLQKLLSILPQTFFIPALLAISSIVASMTLGNIYIHRIFKTYHDNVLDSVESMTTLMDIENWLSIVCNRKAHLFGSVVGGGLLGVYLNSITRAALQSDMPLSTSVGTFATSIIAFVFLGIILSIIMLAAQIHGYQLRLFSIDPSNSEVIRQLSSLLNRFVILFAGYAAFLTLFTTLMVPSNFAIAGVVIMSMFWVPIITMFVINQSSLSAVIQRAKLKTLNEIQANIEKLHASEKLGEKDTMETINRLIDYYERVKNIRTSRVDFSAVLNLFNSLLLPLLALLIGNLDKVLSLFSK